MLGSLVLPAALLLGLQVPGQPDTDATGTRLTVSVGPVSDTFSYVVFNPSTFEPGPLVPHRIDQRYQPMQLFARGRVDYRVRGVVMASSLSVAPPVTAPGSDVDTFVQPSGDVVTSGTQGEVRLWTLSLAHRIEMAQWRGWRVGVAVRYRRSTMDFLASDRIVTHSEPPSETREPVGGDETTWSHVVESGVFARRSSRVGHRWRLAGGIEGYPVARARLVIALPLKYPGQHIRQDTFGGGIRGWVEVGHATGPVTIGAGLTTGHVWSYGDRATYTAHQIGGNLFLRLDR